MNRWLDKRRRAAYFWAAVGVLITAAMVIYPEESFQASLAGLKIWWEVVFPALLPFFIAAEVLMGLGVVHAMGALLEPLMRPLFNVPGVGAFALAMGLASGYPIGAKITARLRKENLCTRLEAERLLSFTNTADPLFMVGAVAVGMFKNAGLGMAIAAAHYLSAIGVGLILRFYGRDERRYEVGPRENLFGRALRELYRARLADGRPFGQLFGDAVREAVNSLLFIGGCILMFSVIIRVLTLAGVVGFLVSVLSFLLKPFGLNRALLTSLVSGFFEITIGCELAAKTAAPLFYRVMTVNAIIAWSGLSVLSQVLSMTNGTDIRILPYIAARVLQAGLAAGLTFWFLKPDQTVLAPTSAPASVFAVGPGPLAVLGYASLALLLFFILILAFGILAAFFARKHIVSFRVPRQ